MTQENINLMTLHEYHLIMSSITKRPYLDIDNSCYMFELESEADVFVKNTENVFAAAPAYYKQMTFCTEFYSLGIRLIHVKIRQNKDFVDIPVEKIDTKKQFFNPLAVQNICRLKQTNQTKYLRNLKDVSFFVPVLIDMRIPKQYPCLHYSYATFNGSDQHYLLFATIQEFETWNKEQENKWKPMEVSLSTIGRIRGKNPILINPLSDRVILTDRHINAAIGERK